ncbi:MAG: hypothetical protein EBU49_03885 [Proteobacteria bacterium]|nr:hypothetical protein [Pseudomonadota bacterium]
MADKSEDTGTARARADQISIADGRRGNGRNSFVVKNAAMTPRALFDKDDPDDMADLQNEMKAIRQRRLGGYSKGGGVTRFKDDHCGHADMKRGGPVKGKC